MGEKNEIHHTDENGEVDGKITVGKNKKGPGGWIQGLFVNEEKRGHGIGGRLVDEALDVSGGSASLEVEATNAAAIRLYKKKGFEITETVQGKDGKTYYRMSR